MTSEKSINQLTSYMEQILLETLTVTQLIKKFPAFYENQRLIIVFTRSRYWSLS